MWAIGIAVTIIVALIPVFYEYQASLPAPKLNVDILNWYENFTMNADNTSYAAIKPTFPSAISNTGNVPIHLWLFATFI